MKRQNAYSSNSFTSANESARQRGLPILVASLTARKYKRIFLLCHCFATEINGNNSNPSKSDRTNRCLNCRGKILVNSLCYGPNGRDTGKTGSTSKPECF